MLSVLFDTSYMELNDLGGKVSQLSTRHLDASLPQHLDGFLKSRTGTASCLYLIQCESWSQP